MASQPVGYIALLKRNQPFRRLWYGQIVSQLGDWFASIALFALLLRLTGSGQAVGLLLVAELLPATLVSLWAGVIVDRLPRKLVLIASDIGRMLLVLLFLLVRDAGDLWIVYAATVLKVVLAAFFEPARAALIPQVTTRDELVAANGISGATWSAMLAFGAALGGLVVGTLGPTAAFLIDAASFGLSAVLIATVQVRETHLRAGRRPTSVVAELAEGLRYLARQRDVALYASVKALWSLGGGVLLVLTLLGREIFPLGNEGALSIGLLYAARGVGAAIGPLVAQRFGDGSTRWLRRAIGPAVLLTGAGYALASGAPSLLLAALCILLAHTGGSTQWVYSTALLQLSVPNRLQGRVFAVELALLTLTTAASSYLTGVAADAGVAPRQLALGLALVFVAPGALLTLLLASPERAGSGSAEPDAADD